MLNRSILDLLLSLPQFSPFIMTSFVKTLMFLFTPLYLDRVDYVKAKCYHYLFFSIYKLKAYSGSIVYKTE